MIISQISTADRQVDLRDLRAADRLEQAGHELAERDADDDAQRDPQREVAFKKAHR